MAKYVMALDSGTTSNRCILFDESGRIRSVAQKEFIQHFPKPGWVEHDAGEIWSTQLSVAREAMNRLRQRQKILQQSVSPIRERLLLSGIRIRDSRFIMPSYGSAEELQNTATA